MDALHRSSLSVIPWFNPSVAWVSSKCKWSCWGDAPAPSTRDESIPVLKTPSKWRLATTPTNTPVPRASTRPNTLKSIEGHISLTGALPPVLPFFTTPPLPVASSSLREFIDALLCIVHSKVSNNSSELRIFQRNHQTNWTTKLAPLPSPPFRAILNHRNREKADPRPTVTCVEFPLHYHPKQKFSTNATPAGKSTTREKFQHPPQPLRNVSTQPRRRFPLNCRKPTPPRKKTNTQESRDGFFGLVFVQALIYFFIYWFSLSCLLLLLSVSCWSRSRWGMNIHEIWTAPDEKSNAQGTSASWIGGRGARDAFSEQLRRAGTKCGCVERREGPAKCSSVASSLRKTRLASLRLASPWRGSSHEDDSSKTEAEIEFAEKKKKKKKNRNRNHEQRMLPLASAAPV